MEKDNKRQTNENKTSSKKWTFRFLSSFSFVNIDREGEMEDELEVNQ